MSGREVTLILPYYENPGMLDRQIVHLAAFPEAVAATLHLIIVDDGSPKSPASAFAGRIVTLRLASAQMFRVTDDVRWNWLTCRNIGVHHATTDWVLLTDIDHELPELTARRITQGALDAEKVYRFSRVSAPHLVPYKPHPNSWLMTRGMFDKVGGYDERFSGFYGTDGEFRDRVRENAKVEMLDEYLTRVPRELIPDASTTRYGRKEPIDHAGVTSVRAQIAREGGRPRRLSFPYCRVL